MDKEIDYLGQYRDISNRLKRRFLKKPNLAEGSDQFGQLARVLKDEECSQYAALCCLAQARCENALQNAPSEANLLLDAARCFIDAEKLNEELLCPSYHEHVTAAVNCYSHAFRVYLENKLASLAAGVCTELGNMLQSVGRPEEAISHHQRAAELSFLNILDCLKALRRVASCKIITRDYEGALNTLTDMVNLMEERNCIDTVGKISGAFEPLASNCEISRVLLLMILQPTPERIRGEHARMLEKYTWTSDDDLARNVLGEELSLLLQSFVMACQARDRSALQQLQTNLWPFLNQEQKHLLQMAAENCAKSVS